MTNLKKILNASEKKAYHEIREISNDYEYQVFVKVRLADIFPIERQNMDVLLFSFALKAHFDFVVCREDIPLFAVEFDGPLHRMPIQVERDRKKDCLCEMFDFPILHINDKHLLKRYNKTSLLRWMISAWELQKAFVNAQERGGIPLEEDFDPMLIFHPGNTLEEVHPHWIALKPRLHIQKLKERGLIAGQCSCGFRFLDGDGNRHGIEWVDVDVDNVICVESAMRAQKFPLHLGELFSELMTVLLYEKLILFLKNHTGSNKTTDVEMRLDRLMRKYRNYESHSGQTSVRFAMWYDKTSREMKWAVGDTASEYRKSRNSL